MFPKRSVKEREGPFELHSFPSIQWTLKARVHIKFLFNILWNRVQMVGKLLNMYLVKATDKAKHVCLDFHTSCVNHQQQFNGYHFCYHNSLEIWTDGFPSKPWVIGKNENVSKNTKNTYFWNSDASPVILPHPCDWEECINNDWNLCM